MRIHSYIAYFILVQCLLSTIGWHWFLWKTLIAVKNKAYCDSRRLDCHYVCGPIIIRADWIYESWAEIFLINFLTTFKGLNTLITSSQPVTSNNYCLRFQNIRRHSICWCSLGFHIFREIYVMKRKNYSHVETISPPKCNWFNL